jgi:hypothetical protein
MFAKVKSQVFIDTLTLEMMIPAVSSLRAILKDEKGSICKTMETDPAYSNSKRYVTMGGLSELPYGVYSLELSHGNDEETIRMVKRV